MSFPATNLTHYYKTDSNFNDNKGSNNGTDTNSPTYATGKINNAFTCVASSSQYTSVSNTSFLPYTTNTYTINLWVKFTSTSGNQALMMTYAGSGNLLLYLSGGAVVHSKSGVSDLSYTWSGADTNWHMWTFVGDGSGMRTYLDGNSTPVASNANTGNITDPSASIVFGGYKSAGTLQAGWYLDGKEDEIGIFNAALSTSDIATLYASGSGITYPDATTVNSGFLMFM